MIIADPAEPGRARRSTGAAAEATAPFASGAWDSLAGGHFYSSSAWLRFTAAEAGAITSAAVCHQGGRLVAAVPAAELTAPPMPLYRWNELLSSSGLPALPATGMLIGPRQGYQTHLLLHAGQQPQALVTELVNAIRSLHAPAGDDRGRACVAMYLTTGDALAIRAAGVAAQPVLLGADAWISVPPDGWTAWLESQTSNRRKKIRQEMRRFRQAGFRISHHPLSACYGKLATAAAATLSKYQKVGPIDDYRRALFRYAEGLGPAARVAVCARDDGDPVGFCIYFLWGDTIFLRWSGFDYKRLAGVGEYFNLLYYEQVRLALERGMRWIHAGITSAEAKARRGALLRPLWLVDFSDDSPLIRAAGRVRQHNQHVYQRLRGDSQTAGALADPESWQAFS